MCPVSIFPQTTIAEVAQHGQRRRTEAPIPQGFVGSNPTLRTNQEPIGVRNVDLLNFGIWLKFTKGNRDSTIARKLRFFDKLFGSPTDMTQQVLSSSWCDKSKSNCLDAIAQYAEFKNIPYSRPHFRAYSNEEMFVLTQRWLGNLFIVLGQFQSSL